MTKIKIIRFSLVVLVRPLWIVFNVCDLFDFCNLQELCDFCNINELYNFHELFDL